MITSASARRTYESMLGFDPVEEEKLRRYPMASGPTIRKLADPKRDIEDVVALLDDTTGAGRRRSQVIERQRLVGLTRGEGGALLYDGRECCGSLVMEINRHLHAIRVPAEYQCETCGAVYVVEQQIREERRHGA